MHDRPTRACNVLVPVQFSDKYIQVFHKSSELWSVHGAIGRHSDYNSLCCKRAIVPVGGWWKVPCIGSEQLEDMRFPKRTVTVGLVTFGVGFLTLTVWGRAPSFSYWVPLHCSVQYGPTASKTGLAVVWTPRLARTHGSHGLLWREKCLKFSLFPKKAFLARRYSAEKIFGNRGNRCSAAKL